METLIKKSNPYIIGSIPKRTSYWEAPILNICGTDSVIRTVAQYYGVKESDIRGRSHKNSLVEPRHVCCHFLFNIFDKKSEYGVRQVTLSDIGREFNRTHSTVWSSIKRVKEWSETDKGFKNRVNELEKIFLIK